MVIWQRGTIIHWGLVGIVPVPPIVPIPVIPVIPIPARSITTALVIAVSP